MVILANITGEEKWADDRHRPKTDILANITSITFILKVLIKSSNNAFNTELTPDKY